MYYILGECHWQSWAKDQHFETYQQKQIKKPNAKIFTLISAQTSSKERREYSEATKERPKGYSGEKGLLTKTLSEKTSSIADGLNKIEAKVADVIREQNKPY